MQKDVVATNILPNERRRAGGDRGSFPAWMGVFAFVRCSLHFYKSVAGHFGGARRLNGSGGWGMYHLGVLYGANTPFLKKKKIKK